MCVDRPSFHWVQEVCTVCRFTMGKYFTIWAVELIKLNVGKTSTNINDSKNTGFSSNLCGKIIKKSLMTKLWGFVTPHESFGKIQDLDIW